MGRERNVYSYRLTARSWIIHYFSRRSESRSIFSFYRADVRVLEPKENFSLDMPPPPATVPPDLDSYHVCLLVVQKALVFAQRSLALAFGKHFVTLPDLSPLQLNHPSVPLDITVLVSVIVRARLIKPMQPGMDVPALLSTVSRDTAIYFAVISSSRILAVVMYSTAARVRFFSQVPEFTAC